MTILAWMTAAGANQYQASPSLCNQWAGSEGETEAAGRGAENVKLLGAMFNAFFDENKNIPKTTRMNLTAACAGGLGPLATTINNQNVPGGANPTFQNMGDNPSEYAKQRFRKAVKMMYGFAANMPEWAYPACRHYYTALKTEAAGGFSADFTAKHIASTEDEKSSLQVARIRATPVAQRNVFAYGNILTAHSGAIKKGKAEEIFKNEIKARQQEFTDTHILLCNYFSENFLNFTMPPAGQFLQIDGVTFVSNTAVDMYEYATPAPGAAPGRSEGKYHVHFSLSATADGSAWAVHHLARATPNAQTLAAGRTRVAEVIGNTQGYTAINPLTYMNDIALG